AHHSRSPGETAQDQRLNERPRPAGDGEAAVELAADLGDPRPLFGESHDPLRAREAMCGDEDSQQDDAERGDGKAEQYGARDAPQVDAVDDHPQRDDRYGHPDERANDTAPRRHGGPTQGIGRRAVSWAERRRRSRWRTKRPTTRRVDSPYTTLRLNPTELAS